MLDPQYLDLLERQLDIAAMRCPPHRFEVAWADPEHEGNGVIFCAMCGDIRSLAVLDPIGVPVPTREERHG